MPERETKKPCHMCKEPGRRGADDICFRCQRELSRLRALEKSTKWRNGLELFNVANTRSFHAWANWAGRYLVAGHLHDRGQGLGGKIATMVLALCPAADPSLSRHGEGETYLPLSRDDYGIHTEPAYMSKEAAAAVVEFKKEMDAELERAYEKGVDYGRDLLAGLAAGDISTSQFDARKEPR